MFTKTQIRQQLESKNVSKDVIQKVLNSLPQNRNFHSALTVNRCIAQTDIPQKQQGDIVNWVSQIPTR